MLQILLDYVTEIKTLPFLPGSAWLNIIQFR